MDNPILSTQDMAQFQEQGYVRVRQAFPQDDALAIQERIWAQMQAVNGIARHDKTTWPTGSYGGLGDNTNPQFNAGIAGPRLCGAIDQMFGAGTWRVPAGWGGFLISFPVGPAETWDVTAQGWHWDDTLPNLFDSPLKSLFIFTLLSVVKPRSGGTLLVAGSHRLIERWYRGLPPASQRAKQKPLKAQFVRSQPWFGSLCADAPERENRVETFMERESEVDGVPLRVVEVTGEPGDAFLCHNSIWHTTSPNHGETPRFMRVKGLGQQVGKGPGTLFV